MVTRGCGKRTPGGAYLCTGLSPFGRPFEDFLIDPPIGIDTGPFRTPQVFEKSGVNHVLVWVGEGHYPVVSDFIEEARYIGISRRVPASFPFKELQPGSMMYLVHPKALVVNYLFITDQLEAIGIRLNCLTGQETHCTPNATSPCLTLTYPLASLGMPGSVQGYRIERLVGETLYKPPDARQLMCEPNYQTAVFGAFPITGLEYVKGENGQVNGQVVEQMSKSRIPLGLCSE